MFVSSLLLATLTDILAGFDSDQKFVLLLIAMLCVPAMVIVLGIVTANLWHSLRMKQSELDLKREMLDRGMDCEEIQQVIEAAPKSGVDRWVSDWCRHKKT